MKILDKWLRPKWRHPDAAVRLKALTDETIGADDCHALALHDPDSAVRNKALERLDSIHLLLEVRRARTDATEAVAARLADLLLRADAARLGEQLQAALAAIGEAPGLARVARAADAAAVRLAAIDRVADPAVLRQCATEDKVVEVRMRALERIDDETVLEEIGRAAKGHDKAVARLAAQRLTELRDRRERNAERARVLEEFNRLANTEELDADALLRARAHWQGLEGDAPAEQRERHAALAPRLEERLAALRQAQREDLSHKAERDKLLAQLRRLAADLDGADVAAARTALRIMQDAWQQATPLQDRWTERRLQEEWQEAAGLLETGLREREKIARNEQAIAAAVAEFEASLEHGGLDARQVEAARQRHAELTQRHGAEPAFEKPLQRLQHLVDRMTGQLGREQEQLETRRRTLEEAVAKLEAALEQRQLDPATAAHRQATEQLAAGPERPELKALQRRLAKSEPLLRELQSWRNWGSDKAREELVAEAQALAAADLDVDERGKQLKSLRARWKALGAGGPKARRQWEAFDAACTAAHEPIKQDRKEQARQREQNLAARLAICEQLERLAADTDWNAPDWRALDRALTQAKRQWRDTGGVPHKKWEGAKQRFDAAVAAVEQHLARERRHNFLHRQGLVREAEALADASDMRQAVPEAKRLREAWQVTAPSPRKDEQALWKAFNGAIDQVFERDRTVRNEFKAGLEEQRQRAEALCAELEALPGAAGPAEPRQLRGELARLTAAFEQLGTLPKQARAGLEKRYATARQAVQQQIAAAEQSNARQALLDCDRLHAICERAEALAQDPTPDPAGATAVAEEWQAAPRPATRRELVSALEQRYAAAMATINGDAPAPDPAQLQSNAAQRSEFCLDLEILRKQASPEALQAARMQRQVALLEEAMKGDNAPPEQRIRELQLAYLSQGPVPREQQAAFAERFGRLFP